MNAEASTDRDQKAKSRIADLDFYKFVIDSLPVAVITVDAELRITGFNPHAEGITGFRKSETLGRYCGEILQGGMCKKNCPLRMVLDNRDPAVQVETTVQKKTGEMITVRMNVAGLLDDRGKLIGGVEAFVDISQLKALEREKSNFISMLAHDMKSPLISIQGFTARLIKKAMDLDDETRGNYLGIIRKETQKLEALINDFLELSRIRDEKWPMNLSATSLDMLLLDLMETYEIKASQMGLRLELRESEPLPIIMADSNALRRVFANLLDNAIKFTENNETIFIETNQTEEHVVIRIIDHGRGIQPEELPYIFDPFHRGRDAKKSEGYGIGLAAVKALVEGHGGQVLVESEPAKGSTFTVMLPKEQTGYEDRY